MVDFTVDPYKNGSGAEKKFFAAYFKGGQKILDHDGDPINWTEANVAQSKTAINAKADPGKKEIPLDAIAPKIKITDELNTKPYMGPGANPTKQDKGPGSSARATRMQEGVEDVNGVYSDEIYTSLDDIRDLFSTLCQSCSPESGIILDIAARLRSIRDVILINMQSDEPAEDSPADAVEDASEGESMDESMGSKGFWTRRVKDKKKKMEDGK